MLLLCGNSLFRLKSKFLTRTMFPKRNFRGDGLLWPFLLFFIFILKIGVSAEKGYFRAEIFVLK